VWFSADNFVLLAAQAACVALPAAGLPIWLQRFRSRAWALVAPLSLVAAVAAIELSPSAADAMTWVALLLVPAGCAVALGWSMHGAWPPLAAIAAPLLALAWTSPDSRAGQLATTALVALSAVTAGRLITGAAPLTLLKIGVFAMAAVDIWLVFTNRMEAATTVLGTAAPGPSLPQLQSGAFGGWDLQYGDFFVAALVGALLAAERGPQIRAAVAVLAASLAWDQLFLVYDYLPATVPPALVLLGWEAIRRRAAPLQRRVQVGMGAASQPGGVANGRG
jgi:hypothetical protein